MGRPSNGAPVTGSIDPRDLTFAAAGGAVMSAGMSQPSSGFVELLLRHMKDDLNAYNYDRDYCGQQLRDEGSLTAQEARTLRLRMLDLGHQIRLCQHKMEILSNLSKFEQPGPSAAMVINSLNAVTQPSPASSGRILGVSNAEAPNLAMLHQAVELEAAAEAGPGRAPDNENPGNTVQRLGYWKCRLCTSPKYHGAPPPRQPGAPCKWPLKDVSKMITHFTEMHPEHTPAERCSELEMPCVPIVGGPFEYWLNRSRSMDVGDGAIIDECISMLQGGRLPPLLRRLSRAAALFPGP
ncbi:unnamed protein product [Parascedosporium putredinis]|uniref:Uncharacterized protein n=1 Tax=Parascedosporium putredinis TaxID=1442378 RepID=A0A9P1H3E0_9PEZI|nr:unnamed protein product [Parascedosporium putredinis]CAI7994729.1 unnamed protein product [Parascedosporium putredinis]